MSIAEGLASYEIYKSAAGLFLIVLFLCISVGIVIYNITQNYVSTSNCSVTTNPDKSQVVTYTVNGTQYLKNAPPLTTTNNNVTTINSPYTEGSCILYYPSANPNTYSVNSNPTVVSGWIAAALLVLSLLSYAWFSFVKSNKNVAAVAGGINIAQTIFGSRR